MILDDVDIALAPGGGRIDGTQAVSALRREAYARSFAGQPPWQGRPQQLKIAAFNTRCRSSKRIVARTRHRSTPDCCGSDQCVHSHGDSGTPRVGLAAEHGA